jgi:hypothetical protein
LQVLGVAGAATAATALGYELVVNRNQRSPELTLPSAASHNEAFSSQLGSAPVLVLASKAGANNPFGPYLTEILRAEGLNCFQQAWLDDVDAAALRRFDTVLLAETELGAPAVEMLEDYVVQGGRLVAMRPDSRLAPLLGVKPPAGSTGDSYIKVNGQHPCARGIAAEYVQYHGPAGHYALDGAEAVAWLGDPTEGSSAFPAVTVHAAGQGLAALWAFDLARSTAYTRQGNPAWVDQERDGFEPVRTMDPFTGWVDLERIAIPQADELQRLLANLLTFLSHGRRPLPRLWYFPTAAGCLLVATADCHTNPASAAETELARVERYGGRLTIYEVPAVLDKIRHLRQKLRWWAGEVQIIKPAYLISPKQVAEWRARGHEFSVHPVVDDGLEEGWSRYWKAFNDLGYGPASPTVRTHKIAWKGWVEPARLQAAYGMRMNLDYYHVGPAFRTPAGEWVFGHFTGSGLPMKFVDETGQILDIYQQATQLADDHLLTLQWGGHAHLKVDQAVDVSRGMFDRSLAGAYAAIGAIFHVDPYGEGEPWATTAGQWLDGTMGYAAEKGIPIWPAQDWLRFWETRSAARMEAVSWAPESHRLSLNLFSTPRPGSETAGLTLTVLLPDDQDGRPAAEVIVDGKIVNTGRRTVGGVSYTTLETPAGDHRIEAVYPE